MTAVVLDAPARSGTQVRLRVLGGIVAGLGDEPVRLRGPRHREVLARLAVARGRVVPVDRLIDDLWPGDPPAQALAAVQTFVSQLRRALEPDRPPRTPARVLVTEPPGYALRLDADAVDAWELERLAAEAGELLGATGGPDAARAALALERAEAAVALCRGPAFAEFADAAWARVEADRLAETALLAHERRAAAALLLGRAADLVPELEAHAAAHPLREEASRLLALAQYASGRQGDALATLRRARATLRDELGVDPGPALRRAERDVLDQAVVLPERPLRIVREVAPATPADVVASGPAATASAAPAGATPSIVGRASELGVLRAAAAAAAQGRGGLVLVSGAPGAGKSALAAQVAAELAASGWRTASGWCPADRSAPPAWPWIEVLESLTALDPPAGVVTEPVAAAVRELLAADGTPAGDPAVTRFRRHRAVAAYLTGLAAARPLLLVLDDLHDADDETLALLCRMAPDVAAAPLLVVATLRDGEGGERLATAMAELARHLPVRVGLGGLDDAAVGELVRAVCGVPVDDRTVAEVARRTGGNAFFVTECARLLEAEGPEAATTAVPAGVRDVLARRIARLPAASRTVLARAAVVGRRFDVELLAELGEEVGGGPDGGVDAVLDAVEPAVLAGLVVEPGAGRPEFAHALVRDVAYESVSRLRRARLHARVARVLERRRPGEVAALAHHFAASGADHVATARYTRAAAEDAEARLAYAEAASLWRQSIDADDRSSDTGTHRPAGPARLDLALRHVRALALGGDVVSARAERERAISAAVALGDPVRTARAIAALAAPALWTTRPYGTQAADVVALAERTLRRLPRAETDLRVRLLVAIAFETDAETGGRGRAAAAEAEALARREGKPAELLMALNAVCMQHYTLDGLAQRTRAAAEMLELVLGHDLAYAEGVARLMLAGTHAKRGEFDAADALVEPVAELARRYDRPLQLAFVEFYRGTRRAVAGDHAAAEVAYREAVASLSRLGQWGGERDLAAYTAYSLRMLDGRPHEAVRIVAAHRAVKGRELPELYAAALAAAGRVEEAAAEAGPMGPVRLDYFHDTVMAARARLGIAIGDEARVAQAHAVLAPYPDLVVGAGTATVAVGPVAQVLGEVAEHRGRRDEAARLYRRALAVAQRADAPRWVATAAASLDRVGPVR